MCRVSVIVPVYQVEAYLPGCLDSILAQTFEDFELILVDDGTKDDCPRIMAEYAAKDARIRQVHKANGGLSSARNAGLDIARGEYIAFVDSDDTVEPTMLADAVAAAERSGAQLVIYNYRLVTKDGPQGAYLPMRDETIDLDQFGLANYFYRYWMPYVHGQEAWCRLYRRDVIERHHLRYAPNDEVFCRGYAVFSDVFDACPYAGRTFKAIRQLFAARRFADGHAQAEALPAAHLSEHPTDGICARMRTGEGAFRRAARALLRQADLQGDSA